MRVKDGQDDRVLYEWKIYELCSIQYNAMKKRITRKFI